MVFFNYSTMQMAAKVVYYGPGLGGKTTNLTWIYAHTSEGSRGEMVSLETETDRTLFFDLLPIDVGSIAGFNTRIQLYTVPGQVFYNTTRKLVLKGVDGVVFVADSQRQMLQANLDSFRNLEENLGEMGLSVDKLPVVIQYNKRDLDDIVPVEELNKALNPRDLTWFEASAVHGQGVFETLKGISKLTLLSLKKRLARGDGSDAVVGGRTAPAPAAPAASPSPPAPAASKPEPAAAAASPAAPAAPAPAAQAAPPAPAQPPRAPAAPSVAQTEAVAAASQAERAGATSAAKPKPSTGRTRKQIDALSELERLRRSAMGSTSSTNGNGHLHRNVQLTLKRDDYQRARRVSVTLSVEDENQRVVDTVRDLKVDIRDPRELEKVSLKLDIALQPKD